MSVTTAPEAALVTALANYLRTQLQAQSDLAQSDVVEQWPEPTDDLALSQNRVVVAISRGPAASVERIGGPLLEQVTVGTGATGTARYEYGEISVMLTVGLWAHRRALRDDVDLFLAEVLNRPLYETIPLVVSTTLAAPVAKGEQLVTPASMANVAPGCTLQIDTGTAAEVVVVKDVRPTGFVATLTRAHAGGVPIVEVAGRNEIAATGLHLVCPDHYGNRALFMFEDQPQVLDDAEGGQGSQRQEWRSIRHGSGAIRRSRDFANVTLQKNLDIAVHATTDGSLVTNPPTAPVFP